MLYVLTSWFGLVETADSYQYSRKPDGQIDGLNYRWTDRPSYRDASRHLVSLVQLLYLLLYLLLYFLYLL